MEHLYWGTIWVLVTILAACQGQTEEDEKRPYKFAFAIEGYQHRSEEKDERGIIMGEFGFVTGDGVYHVTVYATDENGDFKILKMKNYYIGLPGEGTTVAPSKAPPPPPRPTTPIPASVPQTTRSPILQHLDGLKGCSSCVIPDKKKNQPGEIPGVPPSESGEGLIDQRFGEGLGISGTPGSSGGAFGRPASNPVKSTNQKPFQTAGGIANGPGGSRPGVSGGQRPSTTGNPQKGGSSQFKPSSGGQFGQSLHTPGKGDGLKRPTSGGFGQSPSTGAIPSSNPESDRFGLNPPTPIDSFPGKPQYQSTSGKPLPKPGQSSVPGSPAFSEGLPPGMTMEDLMALLYKFNYTLKFHGHHESGYRNGDKEGGYFFNGRDGLGRNVKYLANEFGFQPNITLVDLGLQSPDTPQGGTDELNNELNGYEFKWFYRR